MLQQDLQEQQAQLAVESAELVAQLATDSRQALNRSAPGGPPMGSVRVGAATSGNAVEGAGRCESRAVSGSAEEYRTEATRAESHSWTATGSRASSSSSRASSSCDSSAVVEDARVVPEPSGASLGCTSGSQGAADAAAPCHLSAPGDTPAAQTPPPPAAAAAATATDSLAAAGCTVHAAVEHLLTEYPLAPPPLREQVASAYALLHQQHAESQQQLLEGATQQSLAALDRHGGWLAGGAWLQNNSLHLPAHIMS